MKKKMRLRAEIVSKDYDGILGWIEDIKKDIIYCKEKGWKYANFIEDHTKEKEGAYFACNKSMRKFHWE